ncbi:EAL domain-containing protein [Chelativorans sp. Marseille-P2723]|uniref:putative bifunctional diguanylate cyclase/phosphodiesterase n=1 Tax=Chelativorans sp. Marseille-P2723 TaxID=2709133 RepID=UPI00156D84FD|nr:EAL domain-containing protein [Chelativorans sp. Marseille-P2723]
MRCFSSRTLTSRITFAIGLLSALAVALFAGFVLFAALKVDEAALAKEKFLVRHGLMRLLTDIPHQQENFSVWDEAVLHAASGDVTWLAENFRSWMQRFFGYDRIYVCDSEGNLFFAAIGGKVITPARFTDDRQAAEEIISRLRERLARRGLANRLDIAASDVYEIAARPAIVSAKPILSHTDNVAVPENSEAVFVAVKFIDPATMEEIAHQPLVTDIEYVSARHGQPPSASVRIASRDGRTIGYFAWTPDRPGLRLVRQVAPWAGLALAITLGVGFHLARNLRRASRELHVSEVRARHLAFHDALTGLPNRVLFENHLDRELRAVEGGEGQAALLFLDLDRFKTVNDTLGHRAGDQLMFQAAARLKETVGQNGIIARMGGDEFAVLIKDQYAEEAAKSLSDRLLAVFNQPFQLEDDVVHVGLSLGIAVAPEAGIRRGELLRKADIALYEAKKRRGHWQLFSESMDHIVRRRRIVESDLRMALASENGLRLAYQPLHAIDGSLAGAEALLRWEHPAHNGISPAFLITIAEECGLIMQIGDWVLREACRMAGRLPVPWIAVNVSPVQLRDRDFARRCLRIMAAEGTSPDRIRMEITEAVIIDNPELATATLQILRSAGVRIALDDFGTGYSSMCYLQNFPLDRLKIDRVFVRALSEGAEEGRAIVAAMVAMAHALKLGVTAEGVETAEQRRMLERMGCQEMQGFLFSQPLDAAAFADRYFPQVALRRA